MTISNKKDSAVILASDAVPSSGVGGVITTDFGDSTFCMGNSVTLQDDGKILLGGFTGSQLALARYNSDGSLDTSFDGDGKVTTLSRFFGGVVVVQADGKVLIGGSGLSGFSLVRYNSNGSLDSSFNGGGIVATAITGSSSGQGKSVFVQADGKILLGGNASSAFKPIKFALVRYNSDGITRYEL